MSIKLNIKSGWVEDKAIKDYFSQYGPCTVDGMYDKVVTISTVCDGKINHKAALSQLMHSAQNHFWPNSIRLSGTYTCCDKVETVAIIHYTFDIGLVDSDDEYELRDIMGDYVYTTSEDRYVTFDVDNGTELEAKAFLAKLEARLPLTKYTFIRYSISGYETGVTRTINYIEYIVPWMWSSTLPPIKPVEIKEQTHENPAAACLATVSCADPSEFESVNDRDYYHWNKLLAKHNVQVIRCTTDICTLIHYIDEITESKGTFIVEYYLEKPVVSRLCVVAAGKFYCEFSHRFMLGAMVKNIYCVVKSDHTETSH